MMKVKITNIMCMGTVWALNMQLDQLLWFSMVVAQILWHLLNWEMFWVEVIGNYAHMTDWDMVDLQSSQDIWVFKKELKLQTKSLKSYYKNIQTKKLLLEDGQLEFNWAKYTKNYTQQMCMVCCFWMAIPII